jgi:hypothetical protein
MGERLSKVLAGSVVGPNLNRLATFITSLDGLWGDSMNNMYYTDAASCVIRRVHFANSVVQTVAGTGVCGYNGDQLSGSSTMIYKPKRISSDTLGNIYFTEEYFVRKISPSNIITIIAGKYQINEPTDEVEATSSGLNAPNSLWVDTFGDIFVADTFNHRIRKIERTSIITTFAGNGTSDAVEGNGIPATSARVSYPLDIQGDLLGNIFILEESVLRKKSIQVELFYF